MAEEKKASKKPLHPWWVVLLEGLALVVIGLLFLASPGKSMEVTVVMLGIYWTVDGVFILASLVKDRSHWGSKLAIGLIDLSSVGFILQPVKWTVGFPALVMWLLGIGLVVTGAIKLYHAIKGSDWGVGLLGVVSILFGIPLVLHPFVGDVILPAVLGIAGIIGGIAAIIIAFQRKDQSQARHISISGNGRLANKSSVQGESLKGENHEYFQIISIAHGPHRRQATSRVKTVRQRSGLPG